MVNHSMTRAKYFWLGFWILINLIVFAWMRWSGSALFLTPDTTHQSNRMQPEINAQLVHLVSSADKPVKSQIEDGPLSAQPSSPPGDSPTAPALVPAPPAQSH